MIENKQESNHGVEDLDLYVFGPFVLDPVLRVLRKPTEILPLTGKELAILLALVKHSGKVLGKKDLQDQVWGGDEIGDSTLPTHIKNLRKKLGKDENGGEFIKAEFGNGYRVAALVTRERRPGHRPRRQSNPPSLKA
jgi:DNA-binding winged helix-turn-helix (wHTH) protein